MPNINQKGTDGFLSKTQQNSVSRTMQTGVKVLESYKTEVINPAKRIS